MKKKAGRVALGGMLAALALAFSFLVGLLPPLPGMPPGARLGLSNIVTMYAAGSLGLPWGLGLALVKGGFALLTRGLAAGTMSLCGGLASTGCMWLLLKKTPASLGLTGVCGALAHNGAQLGAAVYLTSGAALGYVPALLIFSLFSGMLTGAVLKLTLPALERAARWLEGPPKD